MKHLVAGNKGQIGSAIQRIFNAEGFDLNESLDETCKYLHICIPYYSECSFTNDVKFYQKKYTPEFTVIHSTVKVGTSRQLNALSSPCRGLHPNLYEGIMTFEKFIGGEQASLVADEFRRHGLKVILCDKQETTELGKLLDTEYYRKCVEFTLHSKELCNKFDVPFSEAYTLFNRTYNESYTKLNHSEYVRPVLQPIMTPISGHCLKSNQEILENQLNDK